MAMFAAAVVSYVVKILVIGVLLRVFNDAQAWDFTAFAWTVIVGTLAWSAGEVRAFLKLKLLYVEPVVKAPGQGEA
jgi:ATP synthase protein I